MKRTLALVLFAVVILQYALIFSTAQAETQTQLPNYSPQYNHPYIRLYDEHGNIRTEFVIGEKIRIVTYFPSPTYLVKLIDPDGNVRFWRIVVTHYGSHFGKFDSGLLSGLIDKSGTWEVDAGIFCRFKVKTFFVAPVAPLGVIGMFAACFAGFGVKYLKTRKNR
jgi:hypothetical protein